MIVTCNGSRWRMKLVRFIYDEKPQGLLQREAVASWPPLNHEYHGKAGHSIVMALHLRLFPSFFSMHFRTTTLSERLKRKKNG